MWCQEGECECCVLVEELKVDRGYYWTSSGGGRGRSGKGRNGIFAFSKRTDFLGFVVEFIGVLWFLRCEELWEAVEIAGQVVLGGGGVEEVPVGCTVCGDVV